MKKKNVLVMSEMWLDGKRWEKIREKLPGGYDWAVQVTKRKNRKGRAIGKMIIGIRTEMLKRREKIETKREKLMVGRVMRGKKDGG